MKTIGHSAGHAGAHTPIGDPHPLRRFWIALTLASMGTLGLAALALAAVLTGLPIG